MSTSLHFTHASLNTFMSQAKNAEDVDRLASRDRHWITLTETAQAETVAMIRKVVGGRYQVLNPDAGDITFLVRPDCPVVGMGGPLIIPAVNKKATDGGHGPRHNSWFRANVEGEDISHTGVHLVTTLGGSRLDQQVKQANAMGKQLSTFGVGKRLAIGSGDLNGVLPNRKDLQAVFDKYGLTTTAEETGVDDPTEGNRRIDYCWTRDADHRLKVDRMKVRHGEQWNSDHEPIDIWATVGAQAPPPPPEDPTYPAIVAARKQSHDGPQFGTGQCQMRVHDCYGIPAIGDFDRDGSADAEDAWKFATKKHPGDRKPPRGYPVFWGGGSHDNGHVAISAGLDASGVVHIWSTDILRDGFFDYVPLSEIEQRWGLPYLGWTEDYDGFQIVHGAKGALV